MRRELAMTHDLNLALAILDLDLVKIVRGEHLG
jgi:hypothetical protein